MVFPQDICYVVQFHWLKYDPLGYATYMLWHHWFQLEMTKMLHHCMCFWPLILCSWFFCPVLWESLLKGIKSIRIFQVCMLKLSPLSKFLHGRWRKKLWCLSFSEQKAVSTPPVKANFIQQSSPCSSYGPLWKRNLSYSRKYRINFCSQLRPIAYCGLQGFGIHFSPNNLECKAPCDSN